MKKKTILYGVIIFVNILLIGVGTSLAAGFVRFHATPAAGANAAKNTFYVDGDRLILGTAEDQRISIYTYGSGVDINSGKDDLHINYGNPDPLVPNHPVRFFEGKASTVYINGGVVVSDGMPTIRLDDTNGEGYWIHNNSNRLYFLWDKDDDGDWGQGNPWVADGAPLILEGTKVITAGLVSGPSWSINPAVVSGVSDDGTSDSPYSRIEVDSFHTNGIGAGQIYIEGSAIDGNGAIRIGKGLAGGMDPVATEFGGTVTMPNLTISASGVVTCTGCIDTTDILDDTIRSADIKDGTIADIDIANVAWSKITTGKPSTFAPSAHTHPLTSAHLNILRLETRGSYTGNCAFDGYGGKNCNGWCMDDCVDANWSMGYAESWDTAPAPDGRDYIHCRCFKVNNN